MKKIFKESISQGKDKLKKNSLCRNFVEYNFHGHGFFGFAPHMTFFVLGFRDILDEIRYATPRTPTEQIINTHCDEDSEHWLWFIEDLERLGIDDNYWGPNSSSMLLKIWSRENFPIRAFVYRIIHYIKTFQDADIRLVIIECLESAFAVFISSLNQVTSKLGFQHKLRYFGTEHIEDEQSHSLHESQLPQCQSMIDQDQLINDDQIIAMIDDIFSGFNTMFNHWNRALTKPQLEETV